MPQLNPFGDTIPWTSSPINITSIGDHIIIPGHPANVIEVRRFAVVVDALVTVRFATTEGRALSGPLTFTGRGKGLIDVNYERGPLGPCRVREGFVINLSDNVQIGGYLQWRYA